MDIIKAEDVCFSYEDGGAAVLRNLDFTVKRGEFVAVIGHNGSGKSTFARLLNGILQPVSGRLVVDGCDVCDDSDENMIKLRRSVGMVFQNPDNQIIATIVEEDVAFALENLGVEYEQMHLRVAGALEKVGMSAYAKHAVHKLSGGQKQRVAIAGIIAMEPDILVLDEPTAMLDPGGRKDVMNIIRSLNKSGTTVVLITHYMEEAALADRVAVMHEGGVLIEGTPHYIFQNAGLLKSVGLAVPAVTELMFRLRAKGFRVPLSVLNEGECAAVLKDVLDGRISMEEQRCLI